MKTLLALASLLVPAPAAAQEGVDKVHVGDRVRVTFRNKNTIVGHLALPIRFSDTERKAVSDPTGFDYSKEETLTIDLTTEYPALGKDALMVIPRTMLLSMEILSPLTAEELEKIQAAIQTERERTERADAENRALQAERRAKEEAERKAFEKAQEDLAASEMDDQKKKDLQAALDVYAKFPAPEWGPEKLTEIGKKASLKLPITLEEREFQQSYSLWLKADDYLKAEKEKAEKAAKEEEKAKEGEKAPEK